MKRIKLILVAVAALGLMAVSAAPALAAETKPAKKIETVAQGETVNDSYIRAGDTVRISGTINGDVLVAASEVVIDGTVNGNVYAIGQSINISGKVTGNVHLASSRVAISGKTGSLYVIASEVVVSKDAVVSGGFMAAASSVDFAGSVSHASYVAASSVVFNGTSSSSLKAATGYLEVGGSAKIAGDLSYSEQADVKIVNDKNIAGSISKIPYTKPAETGAGGKIVGVLYGLLTALVTGAVLLKLAPRSIGSTADFVGQKPARSIITGICFVILVPIALVLLLFTVVGIPLAFIGLMAFVVIWMVGPIMSALWVGRKVVRSASRSYGNEVLSLFMGLLVLSVAGLIPVVGGLVGVAAFTAGVGALVARNWQRLHHVGRLQHKA